MDSFTIEAQEAAIETIAACRLEESRIRQLKMFPVYADWLRENAKQAERWLVKKGKP